MLDTGGGPVKSLTLTAVIATPRQRVLAAIHPTDLVDRASALIRIPSFTTEKTPVARFLEPLSITSESFANKALLSGSAIAEGPPLRTVRRGRGRQRPPRA